MEKKLLIIESPNKIKTIQKYLGKDYKILATVGHIRDLPKSNYKAFDNITYNPNWIVINKPTNKQIIIDEINEEAKKANKIYLATDPDREGEAIAWHIFEVLNNECQKKCVRITFNEITKEAINEAIEKERKIDIDWVHSQFVRRLVDRIIGFSLSKFVKEKYSAKSAGRVQSIVLKFISEREKEIKDFKPVDWWTIDSIINNNQPLILRELSKYDEINYFENNDETSGSGIDFKDEKSAKIIFDTLSSEFLVYCIDPPKVIRKKPREPFKTSTLQQDAINKLGWDINKVTNTAQDLYEGVEIDKVHTALITYPRTDSSRISEFFIKKAENYIQKKYGNEYFQKYEYGPKNKANTQDAHECIRIIDPYITPASIKSKVSESNYKLYNLIWKRTIASLMAQSISETKIIRLSNSNSKFYTYTTSLIFDGFKRVYNLDNNKDDVTKFNNKYNFVLNEKITSDSIKINKHTSQPPARYTQASLIKALDDSGVGRPSTYRSMTNIGLNRGYCSLKQKSFYMSDLGNLVIQGLKENFDNIMNIDFTRKMEDRLDDIADKKEIWNEWIKTFVKSFEKEVLSAKKNVHKVGPQLVGRNCPKCNKPLVKRYSYKTRKDFIGCSGFPDCNYAEFPKPIILDELCPECGHNLVEKLSKKNRKFIGCSNYPSCKYIKKNEKKVII